MIAARLRPYYEVQAKDRKREAGKEYGKGQQPKVVEKIPQPKARDEAGKAAGVFNLTPAFGHGNLLNRPRRTPRPPRPPSR